MTAQWLYQNSSEAQIFPRCFSPVVTGFFSQINEKAVILAITKESSSNTHSNSMFFRTANLTDYNLILWQFQNNLTCDASTIRKHSSASSIVYIASSNHWLLWKAVTIFKFPRAPCFSGKAGRGVGRRMVDKMFHIWLQNWSMIFVRICFQMLQMKPVQDLFLQPIFK